MKPLVFLLLFILVFHIVYDAGAGSAGYGRVQGVCRRIGKGIVSASRMALFIMLAAVLTFTTQPERWPRVWAPLAAPDLYRRADRPAGADARHCPPVHSDHLRGSGAAVEGTAVQGT